jgi:hypothetical protein
MVNLAVLVLDIFAAILGDTLAGHVTPSTWRLTRFMGGAAGRNRFVSVRLELSIIVTSLGRPAVTGTHNGSGIGSLPVGSYPTARFVRT